MRRILIQQGRLIDPATGLDQVGDLAIADGKIIGLGQLPDAFQPDQIINARQCIVCPGLIDLSVRLREPGQSHKASIGSETRAAAHAGVTGMLAQPDTRPCLDTPAVAELIDDLAVKSGYYGIYPMAALTRGLAGEELSSLHALAKAGCIATGNAQFPFKSLAVQRRAMEYAATHHLLVVYHPREHSLVGRGCAHEGAVATRYGLPGIPECAETIAVSQCLELVRATGCRVHFGQLSCRRAIDLIARARAEKLPISADVAVHQLFLTEHDMPSFASNYHVLPPFRGPDDRDGLRQALAMGTVDAICSDHQPHDLDAKLGAFPETEPGIAALETLVPLLLRLVDENVLSLTRALAAVTCNPARILSLSMGRLQVDGCADVCVIDPTLSWRVDAQTWLSQGRNTPFWHTSFKGRVIHTLQQGRLIHSLHQVHHD
ncbi:MAG: dihydroorotase [Methylococcales bacterium]|nr:dihydroorotase [Methylococcales bacterium]